MRRHLNRAEPYGLTLALTYLVSEVSQSSLKSYTSGESRDPGSPMAATVPLVNLACPRAKDWGAAKSGRGKESTPPTSFCLSLPG